MMLPKPVADEFEQWRLQTQRDVVTGRELYPPVPEFQLLASDCGDLLDWMSQCSPEDMEMIDHASVPGHEHA